MDDTSRDDMSVGDLVDNIASTIGAGEVKAEAPTPDQGKPIGDTTPSVDNAVATDAKDVQDAPEDKEVAQPEVDENGNPIEKTEGQGLNPIIDEAKKYLEQLTGKKLSDEETLVEMSKSVVNSTKKHQQDSEDIKDLATRNQTWENWYTENKIEELIDAYTNPRVQKLIDEIKTGKVPEMEDDFSVEDIPKAVQNRITDLEAKLAQFTNNLSSREKAEQEKSLKAQQEEYTKNIREFASKDKDYKKELDEYAERCKLNPYTKLPDKLQKWDKMVRSGVDPQDAWDVINKDKLKNKITEDISKRQQAKKDNPQMLPKSGQKPPMRSYDDANNFDEFYEAILERARNAK